MITLEQVLMGRIKPEALSEELRATLEKTVSKVNALLQDYSGVIKVNDGLRLPGQGPANGATKSKHYEGLAVDLDDDESGTLWNWLMTSEIKQRIVDLGLYFEHPNWTHNAKYGTWVHVQIVPPKSGNRVFIPSAEPDPNPNFWKGKF